MSIKKWLQLSDIHFGSPDNDKNFNVDMMRDRFLEKCGQLPEVDYLFLTGDIRHGKSNQDEYPEDIIEFLKNVQKKLEILPCNTFMVPGNHDISRDVMREDTIEKIKKQYNHGSTIPPEFASYLNQGRQSYLNLYKQICGASISENHFYIPKEDLNIIHINTSILCTKGVEDGRLLIDMQALYESIKGIDKNKPAIAIAHHSFDCLEDMEQESLELLLKQFKTVLYLCGHKHKSRCRNIKFMLPDNLLECVCGANTENPRYKEPAEISFLTGTINTELKSGYIEAYKWSQRCKSWLSNNEFSFPQGAQDGRWYYPTREAVSNNYYDDNLLEEAREKYRRYLMSECEILLDGLPADNDIGSRKIELEKLFVPLRFSEISRNFQTDNLIDKDNSYRKLSENDDRKNIIPPYDTFKRVVFSDPGGGKTTWMKRLASVYGSGSFYDIDDDLPVRTLFPIWVKCREIKKETSRSLFDIIHDIPKRAGFGTNERLKKEFFGIVNRNIQRGTALVLIDGLDEISDSKDREEFIYKINEFAEEYDKVNIVLTSRIVGYNLIAKHLSIVFRHFEIKTFNEKDIKRLCIGWHKIFYGDSQEFIFEAEEFSERIVNDKRILNIARTPVLLTTLLLIKRWVIELPKKREVLYSEAVKVLLSTWSAAARRTPYPFDFEKTRILLAYLAHHMMLQGKPRQIIGENELKAVLLEAQRNLSRIFTSVSETEIDLFIELVKGRSELLVMKGYHSLDEDSEVLEEVFEFSHLSIQEYLAAFAIAEEYYPGVTQEIRINESFENLLEEKSLREVILLTSVLNWRCAEGIANALLNRLSYIREQRHIDRQDRIVYIVELLMQMIADEAPLALNFRERIYKACYIDCSINNSSISGIMAVYSSRYGEELKKILEPLSDSIWVPVFQLLELRKKPEFSVYSYYFENRHSDKLLDIIRLLENAAWLGEDWTGKIPDNFQEIKESLVDLCASEDRQIAKTAFSALNFVAKSEDSIFTGKLLKILLNLFNEGGGGVRIANKFPITRDTIIHLQGVSIIESRKHDLEKGVCEENDVSFLLHRFWFGVLCGAWDIETVIQMAKEFSTADYISKYDSERLCERMKSYLSILKESNAILQENQYLVKDYLDELEQQIQAKKKNDIFDW